MNKGEKNEADVQNVEYTSSLAISIEIARIAFVVTERREFRCCHFVVKLGSERYFSGILDTNNLNNENY